MRRRGDGLTMDRAGGPPRRPPPADDRYTSTGHLPPGDVVAAEVADAHASLAAVTRGVLSTTYPALATVDPALFGICVVGADGSVHGAGDVDVAFPIMSVAKPFTFALVCDALGPEVAAERTGVDATGMAFASLEAVERRAGRTNPMVNAGALVAVASVPGADHASRAAAIEQGLAGFAGRPLALDPVVYRSASDTNHRNRALASLLVEVGALAGDAAEVLDLYTRQSCLSVTAGDLAVMGATLADGGVNPLTGRRVVGEAACRSALAVMATAGMYERSGTWLFTVGLPAKSGISGGMVTVSPGKGGLGTYSPPIDPAGNSVRGTATAARLARSLGLDLFASAPVARAPTASPPRSGGDRRPPGLGS